jgi:chemotaxis protein MotB
MEAFMLSRYTKLSAIAALSTAALLSSGCVTTEKYNALRLERDSYYEGLQRAQADTSAARAQAASFKQQLDSLTAGGNNATALAGNLSQQVADLTAKNAELLARYNDLMNKVGQGPALPAALTNELTRFADENPELVSFDADRGIVKFKSDVTFNSGDAQLTPGAAAVINKFATILGSPAAKGYELLVAGHADNQPVSAPTRQRGHLDNWYLSSHRAITVGQALIKQGIDGRRLGAVGYGDQRPVASNESREGKAANRRVEVIILPNQVGASATTLANPAPVQPEVKLERAQERPELNK